MYYVLCSIVHVHSVSLLPGVCNVVCNIMCKSVSLMYGVLCNSVSLLPGVCKTLCNILLSGICNIL